jgi:hypothetical protein
VLMSPTVKDDGLGEYELGEVGGGLVAPVVVESALVLVDATSVAGAAVQVGASAGTACFAVGAGATYGILLEACTTDDGKGPSAALNYRAVLLHSQGVGSANATLAAGSVGDAELRNSAALSVIGRSANTVGAPADIVGAAGQLLRVSGTTLGFGAQYTILAEQTAAVAAQANGTLIPVDTTLGALTVAPCASVVGNRFAVVDSREQAGTNAITITFGAALFHGTNQSYVLNANGAAGEFMYLHAAIGWVKLS